MSISIIDLKDMFKNLDFFKFLSHIMPYSDREETNMKEKNDIYSVLPQELRASMTFLNWEGLEEIRLRCG